MDIVPMGSAELTERLRTASKALFTSSRHPANGIESFVFNAPHPIGTQSLYFGKPACDDELRHIWFAWFTPWAGYAHSGRMLGLIDVEKGQVAYFPDHQFADGGAAVDPRTGDLIWANGRHVWRRAPSTTDVPHPLGSLPAELTHRRVLTRLLTQPSVSADGRYVLMDTRIGTRCFIGALDTASGRYEGWFSSRLHLNHAQFSPVDPNLVLVAREDEVDPTTGLGTPYDHRMFLYNRDGTFVPVGPSGRNNGHEVWSAGGKSVWFVDFRQGVMRLDVSTGEAVLIWPKTGWHATASACETYVVSDHRIGAKNGGPCWLVRFLNRRTGRSIEFARMPSLGLDDQHQHPHPRFSARDRVIIYTTQHEGRAALAITPVADLVVATA
jgi:hypothetical protein